MLSYTVKRKKERIEAREKERERATIKYVSKERKKESEKLERKIVHMQIKPKNKK